MRSKIRLPLAKKINNQMTNGVFNIFTSCVLSGLDLL